MRAKKWISLMMAGAMAMSLAGCGSQETPASAETTGTVQASSAPGNHGGSGDYNR